MSDLPDPIPAATLILMRARGNAAPEILVMERTANMAFAAGALVFPGGRIEPQDEVLAASHDFPDAPARIAAVRETIEETGIAVALSPSPSAATVALLREKLAEGSSFGDLLGAYGLELDLSLLTPFARWCPNFRETRRFDTFFYVAEAPEEPHLIVADEKEAVRAFWSSAEDILRQLEEGQAHAIFPTRRNLERLARFGSIEEARANAAQHEVRKITPWVEDREGRRFVCIPEDAGYPVTSEPFETARRS